MAVRSGGTSPNARKSVNQGDIKWADHIFVMEKKHRNRLKAQFARLTKYKKIHVLNIPDEYQFMDLELVETLKVTVADVLGLDPI